MHFCSILVILLVPSAINAYRIFHRIISPDSTQKWTTRGSIDDRIFTPLTTSIPDGELSGPDSLYQVALERDGEPTWSISSTLLCHLPSSTSDTITIHLDRAGTPFGIHYTVSSSACAPIKTPFPSFLNTSIIFKSPSSPPKPILNQPPQLTPQGEKVQPLPEKSFLSKYWIYIAIAVVALLFAGGPPPEDAKQ